jgi:myo-inositol-1(or 4)-monophosphatase
VNLDAADAAARDAAREAGALLLSYLGSLPGVETKGEAVNLVTDADRASEALLVKRLDAALPGASILAEEGSGVDRGGAARWIVDPLDGTTNFAHAYPVFCVSIALEVDGERALAVIYDPTRDEMFTARRGRGAFLNGEPLAVTGTPRLDEALLVTGFPYDVRTTPRSNIPQFTRFLAASRAVRRDGSAALDLAYLAAGRFDGFWEEGLAPWDIAAGTLLVEEAGGRVSGYRGDPVDLDAGNLVAANPRLHPVLVAELTAIEDGGTLPPLAGRRRT